MLIGSYDSHLYALGAKDGKLAWKVQTEGYVHATPAVVDGDRLHRRMRRDPARHPGRDGKEMLQLSSGAYTGASPAIFERARLLRHL